MILIRQRFPCSVAPGRWFCTSFQAFGRGDQNKKSLQIFREQQKGPSENVHLNPAVHDDKVKCSSIPCPSHSKSLQVSIIGLPNVGKSTLINQLVGANVCAHSCRVHTTRENVRAILTNEDTQLVFVDTPGVVTHEEAKQFKMGNKMLLGSFNSCTQADLIVVLQDVSNRFTREAINKGILRTLCHHYNVPSVLVLNKMDIMPSSRSIFNLIQKLTCGYTNGVKQTVRVKVNAESNMTVDRYFQRRANSMRKALSQGQLVNEDMIRIRNYEDFHRLLSKGNMSNEDVSDLIRGLIGWPGFKDVFTVSALHSSGIDQLRSYLLKQARPRPWSFHPDLITDDDPRTTVMKIVKSKLMEVLPHDTAYKINPVIESWNVDHGALHVGIMVTAHTSREAHLLLGNQAEKVKVAASLAEQDLQDFFNTEVFAMINVNLGRRASRLPDPRPPTDKADDVFL